MINLRQQQSAAAKAYGHRKKLKSLGIIAKILLKGDKAMFINSDTITSLVYETGDWYFYTNDKYVDHYFVLAFVNWSKMPVILSMCETEAEAQEHIRLLAIELNNK